MNAIGWVTGIAEATARYAGTLQAQVRFYVGASASDVSAGIIVKF